MEISFLTRELREYCLAANGETMPGPDLLDLQAKLAELAAADTLGEVPLGVRISSDSAWLVVIDVNDEWQLTGKLVQLEHQARAERAESLDQYRIRLDSIERKEVS